MGSNRVLVCSIVPDYLINEIGASQAAHNFCGNLIRSGCFDEVHSIVPPSWNHPKIPKKEKKIFFHRPQCSNRFFQFFSILKNGYLLAYRLRNANNVWFYNLPIVSILCYILLRYLYRVKTYIILLDLTPSNKIFSFDRFALFLMNHANGIITLSERINIENKNRVSIAGVIPENSLSPYIYNNKNNKTFLFSGVLSKVTGIDKVIEVFKRLPNEKLYISGIGDISEYDIGDYNNIIYKGYMDYSEYLKMYDEVDVCFSLRNPELIENTYNFPSKILEYLSKNKCVVTSIKYPEIEGVNYIYTDFDVENIIKVVLNIKDMPEDEFLKYCDNKEILRNKFSENKWKLTFETLENNK